MDVKQAVRTAKSRVTTLIDDESSGESGLAEVDFDKDTGIRNVAVGFSRQWARRQSPGDNEFHRLARRSRLRTPPPRSSRYLDAG